MDVNEIMRRVKHMKPCPFCGSEPFVGRHTHQPGEFIVRCSSDGENCPFFPSSGPFKQEQLIKHINDWNNRIAP